MSQEYIKLMDKLDELLTGETGEIAGAICSTTFMS